MGFKGVGFRVLCWILFIVFVQWDGILDQKLLAFSNSAKVSFSNLSVMLLNHTLHPHKIKIGDASGRWFAINYRLATVTTNVRWLQISHTWAISHSNRFSYFGNLMTCNGPMVTMVKFNTWWKTHLFSIHMLKFVYPFISPKLAQHPTSSALTINHINWTQ